MSEAQKLKQVAPADIRPNPENPRLVFRQEEMESLMLSIDRHGIQVPLTVYKDGDHYTLLDGERRWRCATKLNLRVVPVIIQARPSELENLVLMYNIHSLREQWDYYTIASKLQRVIELYTLEFSEVPNEIKLSELTGLTRGAIRRCQLLIDLPSRFKDLLLQELEKPKSSQRLSEDFFIEMERSLKTVTRRLPEYAKNIDDIRDVLVEKFQGGVISAVTDFRQLSKIATAVHSLGLKERVARKALDKVFDAGKSTSIREAYESTVAFEYVEKRASRLVVGLTEFLEAVEDEERAEELDAELKTSLRELHAHIEAVLGS
ncbi:ParB/RepB/Spo0J family partition protein [Luteibacter aegosomaticola]|uniref:ParB/RepB/Spo0J family partition protein n=1 Tax=Luteibacter aegosomaticola TaxID=2911538 RepID=UPI001FF9BC92|nr:ParB/RepB/Spo0J family partition protein [Luteibacter aegosomaticola]UPG90602.1 ParB/RepB/Spo0J family partition protein [Luteibacter aegosomaticola]